MTRQSSYLSKGTRRVVASVRTRRRMSAVSKILSVNSTRLKLYRVFTTGASASAGLWSV